MRVMVIVKANEESEAGIFDPKAFEKMGTYNEELVKAGIMLEGEGLQPSSKVNSIEEAVEWLKRAPFANSVELEIRPMYETADLVEKLVPELRERNQRLRAAAAKNKQS